MIGTVANILSSINLCFLRITEISTRDNPGLDKLYSASVWRFYEILMETSKYGLGANESCHIWVSYLTQFEVCQVEGFFCQQWSHNC